jgi:hypothetical protein
VVATLTIAPSPAQASDGTEGSTWLVGDLTGDGRDEVARFSPATGEWTVGVAEGRSYEFSVWGRFATREGWLTHVLGDFNGNGTDQIANYHRNGNWVVTTTNRNRFNSSVWTRFTTTTGWRQHLVGDFNGNGTDQIANYHRNGNWVVTTTNRNRFNSSVWGWLELDFHWEPASIPAHERRRMRGVTWRSGCPVGLDRLRAVELTHHDFDGRVRTGRLIVHARAVDDLGQVFLTMFRTGFPLASVQPAHVFDGDDDAIMAANVSTAFNCRPVTGGSRWSEHSYGTAIDLNPIQNPYKRGSDVKPPAGSRYLDRSNVRPGMLVEGDAIVTRFDRLGWEWGGRWRTLVDYMHFERPR